MEKVLEMITGPFGALAVMAIMMYFAYRFVMDKVVPIGERFIERHMNQFDRLLESHEKDREVWKEGHLVLTQRLDNHDQKLDSIENLLSRK